MKFKDGNIINKRHGHSAGKKTKTYIAWMSMKQRCLNKNCRSYENYGGRGITVCDDWMDFCNFLKDMGEKPNGKTLERINNCDGYSKINCKWASYIEQANNKRSSLPFNLYKLAKKCKCSYANIYYHFRKGLTKDEIYRKTFTKVGV